MVGIIGAMLEHEVKTILITRLSEEKAEKIQKTYPQMDYRKDAKIGTIGQFPARTDWEKSWWQLREHLTFRWRRKQL